MAYAAKMHASVTHHRLISERCVVNNVTNSCSTGAFPKTRIVYLPEGEYIQPCVPLVSIFYLNSLSQYTSELDHPESLVCISGNSTHWILTSHDNEVKKTTLQKSLSVWGPRHLPNLGRIHGHFSKIKEVQVFISALGKFDSKANKVHCIYLTKEDIKNLKDLCNKCNAEHANTINSILGRVI